MGDFLVVLIAPLVLPVVPLPLERRAHAAHRDKLIHDTVGAVAVVVAALSRCLHPAVGVHDSGSCACSCC